MIPRTRFDIGWRDLLVGFRQLLWPGNRGAAQRAVERHWSSDEDSLACLSLRSGFDVALGAYSFPRGSEVLMSCMNIGPMAEIVEDHGLVMTPIDLDMDRLTMRPDLLERAVTDKTRAIVHAHVLGARQPLDELRRFADRHGLILFEDCAQAYRADGWRGDPRADVSMFSFGPLKTCSATMGGVLRFRDKAVLKRARDLQSRLPVQGRYQFFDRLMLFSELLFFTQPRPYSMVVGAAQRLGLTEFLNAPVRNFRGRNQLKKLRKQPGYPLLTLLLHRLKTFDPAKVQQRIEAAATVLERLPDLRRPGREVDDHGYWLFPICCEDPAGLRERLHEQGFDSTLGHKAFVVLEPPAAKAEFAPVEAAETMDRSLYLPIHNRVPKRDLVRLADAIREFGGVLDARDESEPQAPGSVHAESEEDKLAVAT